MIHVQYESVTNATEGIIIHGCNCMGKMGRGVALDIRNKWPYVYQQYTKLYQSGGINLGAIQVVPIDSKLYVVNAFSQLEYGHDRRHLNYEALYSAFELTKTFMLNNDIDTINFPKIGCSNAGGNWSIVEAMIETVFNGRIIKKVLWLPPTT